MILTFSSLLFSSLFFSSRLFSSLFISSLLFLSSVLLAVVGPSGLPVGLFALSVLTDSETVCLYDLRLDKMDVTSHMLSNFSSSTMGLYEEFLLVVSLFCCEITQLLMLVPSGVVDMSSDYSWGDYAVRFMSGTHNVITSCRLWRTSREVR